MWSDATSGAPAERMEDDYDPERVLNADYDPADTITVLQTDVSQLQARLRPIVDAALLEASQKIVLSAGDKLRLRRDWCLPDNVKWGIHKAIRAQVYDGLRVMPTAAGVRLPYQETLGESMLARIDSGQMHLIEYCNSSLNSKKVSWDYVTSGVLSECNLPACVLHPLDVRKFNARIHNDIVYNMRGKEARYINWYDLWNAVSPWDNQEAGHVRFSLPTAVMVLRMSGMKHGTEVDDFLHFDHPDNNITCDTENRPNNSGHAFVIAKKLAEAWNAMVFRKHREPPRGSDAHQRMSKDLYTIDDVRQTMATLSRLLNKQSHTFKAQSQLFFALRKSKSKVRHVDAERLFQPVITLADNDQIAESNRLYAAYDAGEWTDTGIIVADPVSCPRKTPAQRAPALYTRLADVAEFNWDVAKNTFVTERAPRHNTHRKWQRDDGDRRTSR